MSSELERQHSFSEVFPDWLKTPKETVRGTCEEFYRRALALQNSFGIQIPKDPTDFLKPEYAHPIYRRDSALKICDIEAPLEFSGFLDQIVKASKLGRKTPLPANGIKFPLRHHCLESLPIDRFGFLVLEDDYLTWAKEVYYQWRQKMRDDPPLSGWRAMADKEDVTYDFYFSKEGDLKELVTDTKLPAYSLPRIFNEDRRMYHPYPRPRYFHYHHRTLIQTAVFKNGELFSLWHEEPNGTLFPDPKGPFDGIYPHWVKDVSPKRTKGRKYKLASEKDWNRYMEKVYKRETVISGASGKRVHQTPKQAQDNLEKWRNYLYYLYPQVFRFMRAPFKGELGYGVCGKYGAYVSKNPNSHKNLSPDEVNQRLEGFMIPDPPLPTGSTSHQVQPADRLNLPTGSTSWVS